MIFESGLRFSGPGFGISHNSCLISKIKVRFAFRAHGSVPGVVVDPNPPKTSVPTRLPHIEILVQPKLNAEMPRRRARRGATTSPSTSLCLLHSLET